jgi:protein-disulfide isomerase
MKTVRLVLALSVLAGGAACRRAPQSPAASPSASGDVVVATIDGRPIMEGEVDKRVEDRLARVRQQEYEIRKEALDQIIADRMLEKEAKARGISVDQLLKDEVDRQLLPPAKEEVARVYEQNRAGFGQRPRAEVEAEIEQVLKDRARAGRRESLARDLREKAKVVVSLDAPRSTVAIPANAPTLGPASARVTIVEFADYQCPYCHRAQGTVDKVLSRYAGKVQLVHRDFPLDGHPNAFPAARAARCAGEQGKFWDFHRSLMVDQGDMSELDLKRRASGLKLEIAPFLSCLGSNRHDTSIKESVEAGLKLGVTGTPAFFINGRLLTGARPFEDFQEIIDAELARAS